LLQRDAIKNRRRDGEQNYACELHVNSNTAAAVWLVRKSAAHFRLRLRSERGAQVTFAG
jgi:hypothetical protein